MSPIIRAFGELTAEERSLAGGKGSTLARLAQAGCGDATMRLRTGDRVLVDGGQGEVEILEQGFNGGVR